MESNRRTSRSGSGTNKIADQNESGDSEGESETVQIYDSDVSELFQVPAVSRRKSLLVHTTADMNISASRRKKPHKSDFEIGPQLLEVLYGFCNREGCLRKIVLGHYLWAGSQLAHAAQVASHIQPN